MSAFLLRNNEASRAYVASLPREPPHLMFKLSAVINQVNLHQGLTGQQLVSATLNIQIGPFPYRNEVPCSLRNASEEWRWRNVEPLKGPCSQMVSLHQFPLIDFVSS